MKKGKIFFHPIDGVGSLSISWSSKPKGDAVEAKKGFGVGFFSEKADLLCVIFDEICSADDHQILEFDRDCIEVTVKNGKAYYKVTLVDDLPCSPKIRRRRRQSVSK